MPERADVAAVRLWNRDDEAETTRFGQLLAHYHHATEREKSSGSAAESYEKTGVHQHYVDAAPESHTVREQNPDQAPVAPLPEAYRAEIDDPRRAFRRATVLLAHLPSAIDGCAVLTDAGARHPGGPPRLELKRLWVEPSARGRGTAGGLVRAAIESAEATDAVVQLSVWSWREGAIRLYERLGFRNVPSWDPRPDLVCFERSPA